MVWRIARPVPLLGNYLKSLLPDTEFNLKKLNVKPEQVIIEPIFDVFGINPHMA
jgi:hypothetical protein